MAAETVHVTETQADQPSLFELVAVDGLFASLHPAVRHLCSVLAARYPQQGGWVLKHFNELFLTANLLIQKHYLHTYAGSLAENFYGIKRVPTGSSDGVLQPDSSLRLSPPDVYRSLVWLCGFPYIKSQLDAYFEDLEHRHASGIRDERDWLRRVQRTFLRLYPVLHAAYSLAVVYHYMAYMFGKSRHHSPLSRLCGVELRTVTSEDWRLIHDRHAKLTNWSYLRQFGVPWAVVMTGLHGATTLFRHSLEVGSFFLQFLEWWTSEGDRGTRRTGQVDVTPPSFSHYRQLEEVSGSGQAACPICHKRRTDEAALAVSGYVFCHVCIYRYVSEHGRCPVTQYPATTELIYKLYPPDG